MAMVFDFDYIWQEWSQVRQLVPIRRAIRRLALKDLYTRYLKGWAMGLEFGYQNGRRNPDHDGSTEISAALTDTFEDLNVAVESLWQLANVYRGDWETRDGGKWGWADLTGWQSFFDASAKAMGSDPVDASTVVSNDYVAAANEFDRDQVIKDATDFQLSDAFAAVAMPADAGLSDAAAAPPEATPAG